MNIENQEVYIQCGNFECNLHLEEIMIDLNQYIIITTQDDEHIVHYELPHFYCGNCFWELAFYMRKKDEN